MENESDDYLSEDEEILLFHCLCVGAGNAQGQPIVKYERNDGFREDTSKGLSMILSEK